LALLFLVTNVSASGLSTSSGLIMDALDGVCGLRGWRWLFLLQGLPGVPIGIAFLLCLDESPATAAWLTPAERALITTACETEQAAEQAAVTSKHAADAATAEPASPSDQESPSSLLDALRRVVQLRATWVFACYWLTDAGVSYTMLFFAPAITRASLPTWSLTQIGLIGVLPGLVQAILRPPVAAWVDRGGARRKVFMVFWFECGLFCSRLLAATPLYLAGQAGLSGANEGRFYVGWVYLVQTWFVSSATATFWALHHQNQPKALLPVSIGFVNTFGQLGGLIGPWAFGVLHDSASPPCPAEAPACPASWGLPLVATAIVGLLITVSTGIAAVRSGFAKERSDAPPSLTAMPSRAAVMI